MEETDLMQIIDAMYMSGSNPKNANSLKRKTADCTNNIPNKTCRSNDNGVNKQCINMHNHSIKNCTFYGLPDTVKQLFLQVRGIDTLYGKYFAH